jgi:ribosomal protein S18 acetylase RimI-like enzyme
MKQVDLPLQAQIRLCHRTDLEALEWFGSLRAHRHLIEDAYRRQRDGENWMLVADVRGFPVGQLWVDVALKPGVGVFWAFRIMPPFQGLGIGCALLDAGEALLRSRGIAEVEIGVEPWNLRALLLYRRNGFRVVGEEETSFDTRGTDGPPIRHHLRLLVLRKPLPLGQGTPRAA